MIIKIRTHPSCPLLAFLYIGLIKVNILIGKKFKKISFVKMSSSIDDPTDVFFIIVKSQSNKDK